MNNKFLLIIPAVCAMLTACNQNTQSSSANKTTQNSAMPSANQNPLSQSETDNAITQKINDWLSSDSSLSVNAKNITVSTSNGAVSLKGSVDSSREKDRIINKVKAMQDVKSVNEHLAISFKGC